MRIILLHLFPGVSSTFARLPPPVRVPVAKDPGTRSYMVGGGSAAAGDPDIDSSIARNLAWILNAVNPDQPAEVINLAYTACNSHIAREVVRQSAPYDLDGIIVLVGNNVVIGPFGPGTTLTETLPSRLKRDWQIRLRQFKLGQLGQILRDHAEAALHRIESVFARNPEMAEFRKQLASLND